LAATAKQLIPLGAEQHPHPVEFRGSSSNSSSSNSSCHAYPRARMVWHKSLPKEKMVLSLEEEMDWMPDLDITRVIPAGTAKSSTNAALCRRRMRR
ncbi:hypothetical protein CLOM_g23128, partial [Closterium sp. NIES-68]